GAKQPCRAQAIATIPVMSQAFDESMALSIARNVCSQGAFFSSLNEPHPDRTMISLTTHSLGLHSRLQKLFVVRVSGCHSESIRQPYVIGLRLLPNVIGLEIAICCEHSVKYPSIRIVLPCVWYVD